VTALQILPLAVRKGVDLIVARLPTVTQAGIVRRLVARGNAERDAHRFGTASAFYEEALRIAPRNARLHVQCGHMYKEAGDYAIAENHYDLAQTLLPEDPDLALQMGHFYKVSGRPDEAERSYLRACDLRPGWLEAEEELRRLGGLQFVAAEPANSSEYIVGELMPHGERKAPPSLREGFHVTRLGANRARTINGYRRVVRGVEAIRGFIVSSTDLSSVVFVINGNVVVREALQPHALPEGSDQTKYIFNIWHDFSAYPLGEAQVELRVSNGRGWSRAHRAVLDIAAPFDEASAYRSDAIVAPHGASGQSLEDDVNSRPSMVRAASRPLLETPPRAILVQRADQLGDLVCSVPALIRLRERFPGARIVALLSPSNADLGRTLPMIDEVVVADYREQQADVGRTIDAAAQRALRRTLKAYQFDIALDLAETGGSRPLLLLSGARFLYGFKDRDFPWLTAGFDLATHDLGNHNEMAPVASKLVAMVDALAAVVGDHSSIIPIAGRIDGSRDFGVPENERYVILHTGARLAYSRWPGFAELATMLLEHTDLFLVVMGDEMPEGLPSTPRIGRIEGALSFDEFDAMIAGAAAFVGNDSGPKHLAALRGTPAVSLHMARLNWSEWGQTGKGLVISRKVPCAGCGIGSAAEECGKDFACIRHIRPREVLDALLPLLGKPLLEF
jgi:ADP-heptose:LPS heptosyltransferase/tetratricopeptide (TPR) repeat protein